MKIKMQIIIDSVGITAESELDAPYAEFKNIINTLTEQLLKALASLEEPQAPSEHRLQ